MTNKINAIDIFEKTPEDGEQVFAVCNVVYHNGKFTQLDGVELYPRYWVPMFDDKLESVNTIHPEGWNFGLLSDGHRMGHG